MIHTLTEHTDNALMKLYGSDQWPIAFQILYKRYQPKLFAYLVWLSGQEALSHDLVQNTLMRLYTQGNKYDTSKSLKTWLFIIAKNLWKNEIRSDTYRTSYAKLSKNESHTYSIDDSKPDNKQRLQLISKAVLTLNEEQREAFVLKYKNNLTMAEIADLQNCSVGTVKSRIFYALRHIKSNVHLSTK